MGYSGFVNCNCYKNGKTVPPPYPEYVVEDDSGLYYNIPDSVRTENKEFAAEAESEMYRWKLCACEHEDMEIASEDVDTLLGMSSFRYWIEELGGKLLFPVLSEYLPVANDGTLPAKHAEQARKELEVLLKSEDITEYVDLFDKKNRKLIASTNINKFCFVQRSDAGTAYCIGKEGFSIHVIRDREKNMTSHTVFRSKNFLVKSAGTGNYYFIDKQTGNKVESDEPIYESPVKTGSTKEFIITGRKKLTVEFYKSTIESLIRLSRASVETGNPIIWC